MMQKYIDKDNLYERLEKRCYEIAKYCGGPETKQYMRGFQEAINILKNEPAADVREVKHAKWLPYRFGLEVVTCSNCGAVYEGGDSFRFCPKCGAKMYEEEKNNDEIY